MDEIDWWKDLCMLVWLGLMEIRMWLLMKELKKHGIA
jgi:hypothetical protein